MEFEIILLKISTLFIKCFSKFVVHSILGLILLFVLWFTVDNIEELPLANTPEVFGLHPNAEINYYTQAARDMWSQLVELQPQTGNFI